jgi:hypothetical protein
MVAIVPRLSRPAVHIPPALAELILFLLVGAAVLVLRFVDALPPDVTLPLWHFAPGGPDVAGRSIV